ncbi:hypothetical protein [Bacillus cytotoxicus]|uniref:hypothetical protein n=1 Tax=Bacillus cytotoxicus TaxID=580165 RepID=UPI0024498D58|nr:hypothetical protein [Bacillus cytotoxicus]MDH2862553.1 hypothetical protein [Bacillus cytotoxicus]
MKIISIINDLNNGKKMPLLSKELGISKDTLRRRLNELGYKYDNSAKKYIFVGEKTDKNKVDDMDFDVKNNKKVTIKSDENQKKIIKKEEENKLEFTKEEVESLKNFIHMMQKNDLGLFLDLGFLPSNEQTKRSTIEISQKIYDDFEVFAKGFANRRISKNSLIELALTEFMKKYN